MRSIQRYNFLGSGRLFCYRGNFSGLSNETVGAASYNLPVMDSSVYQLIATVNTFQQLLLRYTTIIVKNKLVAYLIFEDVISEYSQKVEIIAPSDTRKFLQTATLSRCQQWLVAKPVALNLRKPKNPT